MEKELKCSSCGKIFHKYDAFYIGGKPICPYCENNVINLNTSKDKNTKKKKGIFSIFK